MRRFVRGDPGLIGEVATRIAGASDLYADDGRLPGNSINFITCHDGFTLHDLVSYNGKHNEANGEDNRDGSDDNLCWNCGVEGETTDPAVLALRLRQARNFMAHPACSRAGVPMMLAGDEVLRSQRGNNNAYCQDNELSWFDWRLVETQSRHAALRARADRAAPAPPLPHGEPLLHWPAGCRARHARHRLAWRAPRRAAVARRRRRACWPSPSPGVAGDEEDLHVILNMSDQAVDVALPSIPGGAGTWRSTRRNSRSWISSLGKQQSPYARDVVFSEGAQRDRAGSAAMRYA